VVSLTKVTVREVLGVVKDPKALLGQAKELGSSLLKQGEEAFNEAKEYGASIFGEIKNPDATIESIAGKIVDPFTQVTSSGAWGNLSPFLIAQFYAMSPSGDESGRFLLDNSDGFVNCPITEGNFESSMNWQSPFENAGAESKAPNLMAMIQTGQIGSSLAAIGTMDFVPDMFKQQIADSARKAQEVSRSIEGRTGITKINSRQAFSGMPPIKLTMTLHFRALSDPKSEVIEPYKKLLQWAFPQELAADGALTSALKEVNKDDADGLKALFPSKAPRIIGMRYGNMRYEPMVIEGISHPFDGGLTSDGYPAYRAVQLSVATLTALDRNDVKKLFVVK
jgi:hypothetical protein